MALPFSSSNNNWVPLPLILLLLLGSSCSHHAIAGSVKFLPGFEGPLPFELETGYVGVDEGEEVQVFYYFVQSESNPKEDPLILWITGGPGCSSLSALVFEIGPIMFEMVEYNGSLPTLVSNANSWTKMASIIFVDLPIDTGFTYAKTAIDSHFNELQFCNQAYEFIGKWLSNHSEFISNPFYVGGDSYSGIFNPIITQLISNGAVDALALVIDKGYILGNPMTFPGQVNYQIQFSHGMGIIPDELYEPLKRICGGEYRRQYVDPKNIKCLKYLEAYDECFIGLELAYILDPNCGFLSPRHHESFIKTRALDERVNESHSAKQLLTKFYCHNDEYKLAYYWANDKSVREALQIRKGSVGEWQRCNRRDVGESWDSRSYHLNLSKKGYRSLIYSGDHDYVVPHQSTQAWIKELNYSIVDEWRPWRVHGQISGYTRSYYNKMTFATVKGGGHTAPEYRPEECFFMFKRWISEQPL